jgi:hypothetical protein
MVVERRRGPLGMRSKSRSGGCVRRNVTNRSLKRRERCDLDRIWAGAVQGSCSLCLAFSDPDSLILGRVSVPFFRCFFNFVFLP